MKRIFLFLATNLAVVVLLSIVLNVLGLNRFLDQNGIIDRNSAMRFGLGTHFNQQLADDRLKLRLNLRGSLTEDDFTPLGVLSGAAQYGPTQPILDPAAETGYYDWPDSNHGIFIDHVGNVWIGGNGPGDSHIVKFTRDGKFIAQYGKPNARMSGKDKQGNPTFARNSHDQESFGRVAKIFVDPKANEAYIADGYFNKRVAVLDAATGKIKRYWGAYGKKPDDMVDISPYDPAAPVAQQFRNPVHCADVSKDGLVYVCDRLNDRLQVFKADGTYVKEVFMSKNTKLSGSVWDVAFSRDPQQRYLYVADGINNRVYILLRESLEILTTFGDGGRQPSQFYGVHSIATDSKGNVYTTETWEGKRLQKFVFKGVGPVTTMHQGTVWPRAK